VRVSSNTISLAAPIEPPSSATICVNVSLAGVMAKRPGVFTEPVTVTTLVASFATETNTGAVRLRRKEPIPTAPPKSCLSAIFPTSIRLHPSRRRRRARPVRRGAGDFLRPALTALSRQRATT
jgi:hypothetical protein